MISPKEKEQAIAFLDFVRHSPTAFQAVRSIAEKLIQAGYKPLNESEPWKIKCGGKYFITRNQSSVIALRIPEANGAPSGSGLCFQIAASHSDSPMFKLKSHAEQAAAGAYIRLDVEKYGGMILSTWLDRPLGIAGRIVLKTDSGIKAVPFDLNRDAALIPNVPIHFNRTVNDGYKFNPQVDLLPLFAQDTQLGRLKQAIAANLGVSESDVLSGDLYLYNRQPGSIWGQEDAFFSCPRIDNLECAFTTLEAFLSAKPNHNINVYACFDNEEVGSCTRQGADSSFLGDVISRVSEAIGLSDSERRAAIASSFMLSADNAHAVHPNHPELYDDLNRTKMNGGVVIKHNAAQKYTTDAVSDAVFASICERANVPVQHFANRSDVPGGSTLGNIANSHVSMNTVDIGLAQLAMHSAYETAGTKDLRFMTDAVRTFYEADIRMNGDGILSF